MLFSHEQHGNGGARVAASSSVFARSWDSRAAESSRQRNLVTVLSSQLSDCTLPRNHQAAFESPPEHGMKRAQLEENDLLAAGQLDFWYTEFESRKKMKKNANPRRHVEAFKINARNCDEILCRLLNVRRWVDVIRLLFESLKSRGVIVRRNSTKWFCKKQRLHILSRILQKRLRCFYQLDTARDVLCADISKVDSKDFVNILKILEDCLAFIDAHAEYADYATQSIKCEQLQVRALSAIRCHVLAVVREAALLPLGDIEDFNMSVTGVRNHTASFSNVRFRSELSSLRRMMDYLDTHGGRIVVPRNQIIYSHIIIDCCGIYCEQRIARIVDPIRTQLLDYFATLDLIPFTQTGCAFMFQVLARERELFSRAFPLDNDDVAKSLAAFVESLGSLLQEIFRPRYIPINDICVIADLIDTLRNQEDIFMAREDGVMTFLPITQRLVADVQERLIYRAHTFVQEEVANYRPSNDELNYPMILAAPEVNSTIGGAKDVALFSGQNEQRSFPPVVSTLYCLGTLYRALDGDTFSGLAEDTVRQCLTSIKKYSKTVASNASESDGQLFMIKYLMLLREQMSPFESHLTEHILPTRELNFAHLHEEMQRMLTGGLSVFSISPTENALVVLATKGAPRVVDSTTDSRTELEGLLRASCEAYIMNLTRNIVGPMLGFLTKFTAFRASTLHGNVPLSKAAFATSERLFGIIASVNYSMQTDLTKTVKHMSLYIRHTPTRDIILNPVKNNIVEAHRQMAAVLQNDYGDTYIEKFQIKTPDELAELLHGIECSS